MQERVRCRFSFSILLVLNSTHTCHTYLISTPHTPHTTHAHYIHKGSHTVMRIKYAGLGEWGTPGMIFDYERFVVHVVSLSVILPPQEAAFFFYLTAINNGPKVERCTTSNQRTPSKTPCLIHCPNLILDHKSMFLLSVLQGRTILPETDTITTY